MSFYIFKWLQHKLTTVCYTVWKRHWNQNNFQKRMFSLSSHEDLVTSGCLKYLRYASWKLAVNGIFSKKRLAKKSHRMLHYITVIWQQKVGDQKLFHYSVISAVLTLYALSFAKLRMSSLLSLVVLVASKTWETTWSIQHKSNPALNVLRNTNNVQGFLLCPYSNLPSLLTQIGLHIRKCHYGKLSVEK